MCQDKHANIERVGRVYSNHAICKVDQTTKVETLNPSD